MVLIKRRYDFIKGNVKEFRQACLNYIAKIQIHGPTLGMTEEEIAAEIARINKLLALMDARDQLEVQLKAAVKEVHVEKDDFVAYIRNRRETVRENPACTDAMWIDLGFNTTYASEDSADMVPELKARLEGEYPVLKCQKNSTDGWRVYSRIDGIGQFQLLGVSTTGKYMDVRPKADPGKSESREYYLFYMLKDEVIGQKSNIVELVL
ncbi:hypothetical protein [Marinifilum sp. D714]|uniref:hypothetical protein n=1 Tax=Marinifilum sp. D714 TaxID=2937523 RepID=UPI0027CC6D94|nr:hypothetical protein [Marinifilum sp. D714]MDQ2177055.1 hypothetical protein [Marinifilum sp. D714]